MSLILRVDNDYKDVNEAFEAALRLSKVTGCVVVFPVMGDEWWVRPSDSLSELLGNYGQIQREYAAKKRG